MQDTEKSLEANMAAVVEHLETLIADSYALMAQTHLAHWNVQGPNFFALHTAFQEQYEELFTAIDDIAEHLRTLGSFAPGGLGMLERMSEVGAMERSLSGKEFVKKLIGFHKILIEGAQAGRSAAANCGLNETEDLFIERLRVHNKTLWMLQSAVA